MPTDLMQKILLFKDDSTNFIDILYYFKTKIHYLSYKLKYPEAYTDLIIYLYELLPKLDFKKFNNDDDISKYVNRCLQNQYIKLSCKNQNNLNSIFFSSNEEMLDILDCAIYQDQFSDINFIELISFLPNKQQQIVIYKFYYCLSDSEIGKIFNISRQAIHKSLKNSLEKIKLQLSKEEYYV